MSTIEVIDSASEEPFFRVPEAKAEDISRAVAAARAAFDDAPRRNLTHGERAEYLRAFGDGIMARADAVAEAWTRETGTTHQITQYGAMGAKASFDQYAALADTYPWEEPEWPHACMVYRALTKAFGRVSETTRREVL